MATHQIFATKLLQYARYRTVFKSHRDIELYRQVRDHPERCDGPVRLGIRGVAEPLFCRPQTMDAITLWDAFFYAYHLPVPGMHVSSVILDLGANAGYTAASLATRYPRARVIAVEMDADNAAVCARNVAQFGDRCEVIHAAIWSAGGSVTYGGGNVHDFAIGAGSATSSRTAPAITVDEVMDQRSIAAVDYVKMDIEGAEASVLRPPISWAARVNSLSLEVHPPATFDWCRDVLTDAGFICSAHPNHPAGLIAARSANLGG
jgi:FkbM family methyltransferase